MSFLEKKYGLRNRRVFFPYIPSPKIMPTWVDREKELNQTRKILKSASEGKSNRLVFVVADYGLGKSMTLLKILEVAREELSSNALTFYTNFLSPEKIQNPGIYIVFKIMKGILQTKPRLTVGHTVSGKLSELHPDVLRVFRIAFSEKDKGMKQTALDFLQGVIKPSQAQLKALGITRKIDSIDVSIEYLVALLLLLGQSGISVIVGAMDEFEYIFTLASKSAQPIYLALLRELYDLPSKWPTDWPEKIPGIVLFFGLSEDGWRYFLELGNVEQTTGGPITPLRDRIDSIFLRPFDRATSEELIEKRLRLNRISGRYERNPLIPFTKNFVDLVVKTSEGKPRWIIRSCDYVLDAGLEQHVELLDADFARAVLTERGIIEEAEPTKVHK